MIKMPADFDSGMFVHTPAWHGEGNLRHSYPENWAEARRDAGLMWEPEFAPNFGFVGLTADGKVTHYPELAVSGDYVMDKDAKRVVRSDTGFRLSVRDESYELISHEEMGQIMEALVGVGLKIETAGSVMGGRRVWALVRLDEPIVLPGDTSETYPFMAVLNRHDGTGACKGLATSVRVVCSNTFSAAEAQGEKTSAVFTFRHHANWRDHIEDAKAAITGQRRSFAKYVEIATDLARTPVTRAQEERFIVEFVPVPAAAVVSDKVMGNVEEARQTIRNILDSATVEGAGIRGTAFGLLQAAGEYRDHFVTTRKEGSLVARQLLSPNRQKIAATALLRDVLTSA